MNYKYLTLEKWLLDGIHTRRWNVGERLPSIRQLCSQHKVSKATAQHALQRIEARGLTEARPKAGYFVIYALADPIAKPQPVDAPRLITTSDLFLDIMSRSAAFDLLPYQASEAVESTLVTLNRAIGRSLRQQGDAGHQYYDDPMGSYSLREQLSIHHRKRGWDGRPEQLCITSGCQNALFLSLMAVCKKGDIVAVETPGFYGVLQLLEQLQLHVIEIPSSATTGLNIDALAEAAKRWHIRACVVSPAFATPSGALMPMTAKLALLALAETHDIAIIEDDIYADTALLETPTPLKALDRDDRVILCSSFSKCLSRDIRLGWVSGARWHKKIVHLKLVTQLSSSRFLQQAMANFMRDGHYTTHLKRQRSMLKNQKETLIASLNNWSNDIKLSNPEGGLSIWVELPHSVDLLATYSLALNKGIVITPGPLFSVSGQFKHCLRISFVHAWNTARRQALTQLTELLTSLIEES